MNLPSEKVSLLYVVWLDLFQLLKVFKESWCYRETHETYFLGGECLISWTAERNFVSGWTMLIIFCFALLSVLVGKLWQDLFWNSLSFLPKKKKISHAICPYFIQRAACLDSSKLLLLLLSIILQYANQGLVECSRHLVIPQIACVCAVTDSFVQDVPQPIELIAKV